MLLLSYLVKPKITPSPAIRAWLLTGCLSAGFLDLSCQKHHVALRNTAQYWNCYQKVGQEEGLAICLMMNTC
jgi:hypothetical protein